MIRDALQQLLSRGISRRDFVASLGRFGIGASAAGQLAALADSSGDDGDNIRLEDVTGGRITCETLRLWDVDYVFGNTGAYEAGFVDALVDYPGIQYVLGLHEGSVVAMADGYARATGKTAFVNVHSITGTANALGMIVNAAADNSPIVVSVGFSETGGDNLGVFTETQKVESVAELFTKLSFRCTGIANLGESLRRAFRLASILPSGPVFLGVPSDIWSGTIAKTELIPALRTAPAGRIYPDSDSVRKAVQLLASAENPLIVSGAELPRWGGLTELADIADLLGAAVSGDTASSRSSLGFPGGHPRYLGALRGAVDLDPPPDVVLLAGTSRLSLARGGHPLIPLDARIIELGLREEHLARNYPADLIIYAHPEVTLKKIRDALRQNAPIATNTGARRKRGERRKAAAVKRRRDALQKHWDEAPVAPERLAFELDKTIDDDALIVTEGVTSDAPIRDYVGFDQPNGGRRHLISSGGSLGWGIGAGIGAKLGTPDRQVVALVGDGSFQFGVQGLWTASKFRLPLIVVIFNNQAYQANRWALARLDGRSASTERYIGINLQDPEVDHVTIARGYGFDGERVGNANDLPAALTRAIAAERDGRGYVLDVLVARRGAGADSGWHETVGRREIPRRS